MKMLRLPITEFDVQALVDSHLSWEDEKEVWRGVYSNPALEAYYKQIVNQRKLLVYWWQSEMKKEGGETPPENGKGSSR